MVWDVVVTVVVDDDVDADGGGGFDVGVDVDGDGKKVVYWIEYPFISLRSRYSCTSFT